jgi:ABC-type transporter Mla subunit MlaD
MSTNKDVFGTVQDVVGLTETAADRVERLVSLIGGDAKGDSVRDLIDEGRGYLRRASNALDRLENKQ